STIETRLAVSRAPRAPILRGASAAPTARTRTVGNPKTDNPGRPLRAGPVAHYRSPGATSATGVVVLPGLHVSCGWIHHDFRRWNEVDPPAENTITLSCGVCPRDNA